MKIVLSVAICMFLSVHTFGQKKEVAKVSEAQATKAVMEAVKGAKIQSSELEREEGKLIWSFDVTTVKGTSEVWVDAMTGKVIKAEVETQAQEKEEYSSENAEKAALKKVPGDILTKKTEKEKGKKIYSFEIKTKKGKTVEVDVDAKTNKVIQVESDDDEKQENEEDDDND
ncbi:MAG: PepSY domain-containing protein [Ignavibacteriae bacterium]|nr:PepSY domain-containing protein [Ignavibacteria bacterium]MBI3364703.1 PepSY domain-containing protein [Ignavibacteriota bacterium]